MDLQVYKKNLKPPGDPQNLKPEKRKQMLGIDHGHSKIVDCLFPIYMPKQ